MKAKGPPNLGESLRWHGHPQGQTLPLGLLHPGLYPLQTTVPSPAHLALAQPGPQSRKAHSRFSARPRISQHLSVPLRLQQTLRARSAPLSVPRNGAHNL